MARYITTEEAAKLLYTTPYTVRKYIRKGLMSAARIGKHYLILEDDLANLLKQLTFKKQPKGE
jgi:excisionase family DNA binding protein